MKTDNFTHARALALRYPQRDIYVSPHRAAPFDNGQSFVYVICSAPSSNLADEHNFLALPSPHLTVVRQISSMWCARELCSEYRSLLNGLLSCQQNSGFLVQRMRQTKPATED